MDSNVDGAACGQLSKRGGDRVHGDRRLGAALRQIRTARGLTLDTAARRAGCATSLLGYVETGHRALRPWLAAALDRVYCTGGAITALADSTPAVRDNNRDHGDDPVVVVLIPGQGSSVPLSRRELLAALGIGASGGALLTELHRAVEPVRVDDHVLAELTTTLAGLSTAGRVMAPSALIGPLTAQVALIHALRRRAPDRLRTRFTLLEARAAESLSWMAEEAGDLNAAVYWTDRAGHWGQQAGWQAMAGYAHVRRSMLAISYAGDGRAAVDQAEAALHLPGVPARVRAMAHKQIAYGHALCGSPDPARYALDKSADLLAVPVPNEPDRPVPGQNSVPDADLLAIYTATCDVYLGAGERVVHALTPRLRRIRTGSARTAAITVGKMAQAHANAGDPGRCCQLILNTLDTPSAIESLTTLAELRRAVPTLTARWPDRDDVHEVRHRLSLRR